MTLKYEAEILYDLMKRDGDDTPSDVLPYESELKEKYLNQVVGAYPKLQDYRPEWLNYNLYKYLPADFPVESVTNVTNASFQNVVPYAYKSAILSGNTLINALNYSDTLINTTSNYIQVSSMIKNIIASTITVFNNSDKPMRIQTSINGVYNRQISIKANSKLVVTLNENEKLDRIRGTLADGWTIDETGVNELKSSTMIIEGDCTNIDIPYFEGMQSVKVPVLTTSNEDGTKTNILTVNEPVELRGIGEVRDTLDCLTGEVTERIGEIMLDGSETKWVLNSKVEGYTRANIPNITKKDNVNNNTKIKTMSDTLPSISFNDMYIGDGIGIATNEYGNLYIRLKTSDLISDDINGIKDYLSKNNVTVQYLLNTESIKTVDLTCINEQSETVDFMPLEGTMNVHTSSDTIQPLLDMEVPVEAITQNLNSFASMEE